MSGGVVRLRAQYGIGRLARLIPLPVADIQPAQIQPRGGVVGIELGNFPQRRVGSGPVLLLQLQIGEGAVGGD